MDTAVSHICQGIHSRAFRLKGTLNDPILGKKKKVEKKKKKREKPYKIKSDIESYNKIEMLNHRQ